MYEEEIEAALREAGRGGEVRGGHRPEVAWGQRAGGSGMVVIRMRQTGEEESADRGVGGEERGVEGRKGRLS